MTADMWPDTTEAIESTTDPLDRFILRERVRAGLEWRSADRFYVPQLLKVAEETAGQNALARRVVQIVGHLLLNEDWRQLASNKVKADVFRRVYNGLYPEKFEKQSEAEVWAWTEFKNWRGNRVQENLGRNRLQDFIYLVRDPVVCASACSRCSRSVHS
jgi:hypothetical protein